MTDDQQAIWAAINDLYQGFLAGDRARVDGHLRPDATVWDSEEPALAHGKAELDALRAARPSGPDAPAVTGIETYLPVIDVYGDTAVLRHVLVVRFDTRVPEVVRNTSVWRKSDGRWRASHNHEDVLPAAAAAAYLPKLAGGSDG
ncbi:ketosteroid isomerase-like protein [Actinoplanes tereljensis]|uniref:DUF4440 domain-containing protein n=1 Tax=Paractinoplanes tereljensis TaxID=571912 RepID=A0A919NQJ5_9ACTN|nr:nuclear transport factor 2 family protein [Actinoplanes tereljensis]GIF23259.1 hypothetical protein Ate02nite_59890 [Actinoplanes tereljensis]